MRDSERDTDVENSLLDIILEHCPNMFEYQDNN